MYLHPFSFLAKSNGLQIHIILTYSLRENLAISDVMVGCYQYYKNVKDIFTMYAYNEYEILFSSGLCMVLFIYKLLFLKPRLKQTFYFVEVNF